MDDHVPSQPEQIRAQIERAGDLVAEAMAAALPSVMEARVALANATAFLNEMVDLVDDDTFSALVEQTGHDRLRALLGEFSTLVLSP